MLSLPIKLINMALTLFLMTGCAEFDSGLKSSFATPYEDPYAQSDLDELLNFGANMSNIPASSRAEVCRLLVKRQKTSTEPGIQLHLMIGRLLSDTCGDIPKILDGVAAIPAKNLFDDRVQKLVAIHTEALKRMKSVPRKLGSLERKQKSVQTVLEPKESKDSNGSKKDEARLLREKLEAIRSMEKQLDESGDGN